MNLLPNEKVLFSRRQSESILIKPVLLISALIYAPWFLLIKYELVANYLKILTAWTAILFIYGLRAYFLWLLNGFFVTNKRVISVKFFGIFNKQVKECPWDKVLNVSYSSKGFFASIFSIGDVEIQAQGLSEPIIFSHVSNPAGLKDSLWKFHGEIATKTQNHVQ